MARVGKYLRVWFASTLLLLAAVALFNALVDPYGMFRFVAADGFNRIKSQAHQRGEAFKRAAVSRLRPNALILGNSRAEIGLDPESPAWPASAHPVFNLALPGTGTETAVAELRYALRHGTPRVVVVGLDFVDFRVSAQQEEAAPDVSAPRAGDRLKSWRDHLSALFTLSALADSLATVRAQSDPYATSLTETGFNPMRDYVGIARREGYEAMFRQRDQENANNFARGGKTVLTAGGRPGPEFRAVDRLVSAAAANRIDLHLVIYPYHAHTLVLFHQAGLWPAFERWKRELVRAVEAAPLSSRVAVWDFTGFAPFAGEPVPPRGDTRTELRWYWEAGHFKKALGDILLARLFDAPGPPEAWGVRLTAGNLEQHLSDLRAARDEYERDHPRDVAELASMTQRAQQRARASTSQEAGVSHVREIPSADIGS